jgi:hypothetical protein
MIQEFINAGVTAYAVGCTDEGLRKELLNVGQAGAELDGSTGAGGGANVVLKSKIRAEEVEECILWVSIVFITILCTPQPTIVRWSSTPAVSAEAQVQWRGFCALIANAYYVRGMAWYITFTSEEKLSTSESASTEKHDCQIGEII